MPQPKQHPSPKNLRAIADAGMKLAEAIHQSPIFWHRNPNRIPFSVLVSAHEDERVANTDADTRDGSIAIS